MATMKQPSIAMVALMLALVMLAPGGARAACDASQLAVCLPAITTGSKPAPECCANLKAQQGCLCRYAEDPSYGHYVSSPYALKLLASCDLPFPRC